MANECLYQVMVQNIPHSAILVFDHNMRYELAEGSAIQELTGHGSSFYIGKLAQEVASFANRVLIEKNFRAALQGETRDQDVRIGAQFAALHTAPIRGENGAIVRGMAFLYNITARKQLEAKLLAQTEHLELLSQISDEVNKASSLREALARLLQLLGARWNYAVGHVLLRKDDSEAGELESTDLWWTSDGGARFEPFKQAIEQMGFAPGKGYLPDHVFQARNKPSTWSVVGFQKDPTALVRAAAAACGLCSASVFPVLAGADNEVTAVLEFFSTTLSSSSAAADPPPHPPSLIASVMQSITPHLTRVIERERHAALSTTDDLTHLHNRRGFLALARHHLASAERTRKPLLLLFADLDGLKHVNDTYGHAAGDGLIAEAGRVLREAFRASDIVARLGGDEFAVLMPETDVGGSGAVLGRLRAGVEEANGRNDGGGGAGGGGGGGGEKRYKLELSLGLTSFDPERPETLDGLLDRADALMYEDKRARKRGRDGGAR
ncbi:Diguanylate cyclase YegE [Lasiodiplodia theobromae]|uniref:Diguanylate cyclase YegE n=1 Tax=Lasiodiplodia theobromae TaxID=45133 RepID=UPI0015C3DFCF|nr:Diguanylate cyclase YegE [Lasiodiplodia theobromae]KAF4534701.1 Diguanylate cyclase YegE [Lasiodiplodia theobromae]